MTLRKVRDRRARLIISIIETLSRNQLAISRVAEYKEDPKSYSYAIIIIGRYNVDGYEVFMESIIGGNVVNETFAIVSTDELLDEDLKEYAFKLRFNAKENI